MPTRRSRSKKARDRRRRSARGEARDDATTLAALFAAAAWRSPWRGSHAHAAGGRSQRRKRPQDREAAYRANNIGVALLEQFDYDAAAASFREALKIAPDLALAQLEPRASRSSTAASRTVPGPKRRPPPRSCPRPSPTTCSDSSRGRRTVRTTRSAAFQRVLAARPDRRRHQGQSRPGLHAAAQYDAGDHASARGDRRRAVQRRPPRTASAMALTRSGDPDEGRPRCSGSRRCATHLRADLLADLSRAGQYAEALASTGAEADLVDAAPPAVTFADATADDASAERRPPPARLRPGSVVLVDIDNDGDLDILESGADGLHLFRNAGGSFADASDAAGLATLASGPASIAVAGDYDNDGRADLFVAPPGDTGSCTRGRTARSKPRQRPGLPAFPHRSASAAFVDVDHDGDLDLYIAGDRDRRTPARPLNQLLRNNGNGTFTDITAEAKVAAATAARHCDRADGLRQPPRHRSAARRSQSARRCSSRTCATDRSAMPQPTPGCREPATYSAVAAGDVNKDGFTDFFLGRARCAGRLRDERRPAAASSRATRRRHRPARWPRSSSTTTTTACSICSSLAPAARACSATSAAAGPT